MISLARQIVDNFRWDINHKSAVHLRRLFLLKDTKNKHLSVQLGTSIKRQVIRIHVASQVRIGRNLVWIQRHRNVKLLRGSKLGVWLENGGLSNLSSSIGDDNLGVVELVWAKIGVLDRDSCVEFQAKRWRVWGRDYAEIFHRN